MPRDCGAAAQHRGWERAPAPCLMVSHVIGAVAILIALFVIGPIGLMLVGAIWSALQGWLQSKDADRRAGGEPQDQPA
jgi:hypothetical protein